MPDDGVSLVLGAVDSGGHDAVERSENVSLQASISASSRSARHVVASVRSAVVAAKFDLVTVGVTHVQARSVTLRTEEVIAAV